MPINIIAHNFQNFNIKINEYAVILEKKTIFKGVDSLCHTFRERNSGIRI